MCGIFGWARPAGTAVDIEAVQRASDVIAHRGPDDWGFAGTRDGALCLTRDITTLRGTEFVLAHRRLSILDLSQAGWQPMSTPDGRWTIIYNGEIYNYLELRGELEREGVVFRSHTDTEVLLHALIHWGVGALPRLTGMFAFALWDRARNRLLLARDFFGIKPLFYSTWHGGFAFASEMKALLELPGITRDANPKTLHRYLTLGLTDDTGDTMISGISQLAAAHHLEIDLAAPHAGVPSPARYWRVQTERQSPLSFASAADELRALFLESIRLHLRSDVPVGAALSGGIDSSAIVMAMRHVEPGIELHAFSYIADDPSISEERWVDLVGEAAGATVHKTRTDQAELLADLDHVIATQDEPFGSTSIYAQHRVFRLAHEKGIKVMLDGQGADELLAGYSNFLSARLATLLRGGDIAQALQFGSAAARLPHASGSELLAQAGGRLLPTQLRPLAKRLLYSSRGQAPTWLNGKWFADRGAIVPPPSRRGSSLVMRELLADSVEQGLLSLLRYEDRNSMAFSVESRVPFLTPKLADFLLSLPEEYIMSPRGVSKSVFRTAMRGIVPDAVLDRRDKIGFSTPEKSWLTSATQWVDAVLSSDTARRIGPLNVPEMRRDWQAVQDGRSAFNWRIWRWINLVRWAEQRDVRFK